MKFSHYSSLTLLFFSVIFFSPFSGLNASRAGKLKWKFTLPDTGSETLLSGAGAVKYKVPLDGPNEYSCPAIAPNGTICFGSHDKHLYALNADGTFKWMFWVGHRIFGSPAIDEDGTVYTGSDGPVLHAINPYGREKWSYRGDSWFRAPAIGGDGTLYASSGDGYLYALDRDGTLKWKYYAGNLVRHAVIGRDGTIYCGTWLMDRVSNVFCAIAPDGTQKWTYNVPGGCSVAAVGDEGTIYFCCQDGCLYALNPDGTLKWRFLPGGWSNGVPVIDRDGVIYFGSYDGYFYAVNPDGTLKWRFLFRADTDMNASAAIDTEGNVYFGTNDWNFYALNPDGTLKWRFYTKGNVNCSPAIDENGIVYFGSMDNLFYALDTGTGRGLADSPWPKFGGDMRNSCRVSDSISVQVSAGVLSVDSVLTAFDSTFAVGVSCKAVQQMSAVEFVLNYDHHALRADSVCSAGETPVSLAVLGLDLEGADTTGVIIISLVDVSFSNPVPVGTTGLVNVHFTEIGNVEQVLELTLSNCAGSSTGGEHLELRATPGKVVIRTFLKCCDINGDGAVDITDMVAFLLNIRAQPGNLEWDWNGDGITSIADVVTLLMDIRGGRCPDVNPLLASALSSPGVSRIESLSDRDIAYLEEMLSRLPLTPDEESAFRLAVYGAEENTLPGLPMTFELARNFPNPFNPATSISYSVPVGHSAQVELAVFTLRGRLVRTLVDSEKSAGGYTAFWDGTDSSGRKCTSGVYLYRIKAGNFSRTRKMVLLK
ncbi:MAG: PQQ-binding-like beta-propeller repeat protein [Gemmatimonadota bacterium]|nr:PQQ-binding-like beta-propeller repeat protein [Gemmatimonadota bacterium]